MTDRKKLMVIGASWEQVPLIEEARKKAVDLVLTDPNPNEADFFPEHVKELLDPRDLQRALELAKKYQIDCVVADQCDYSRYAAVYLADRLQLGPSNLLAAQLTTNKMWMRDQCRDNGVLQPLYHACRSLSDLINAAELIGFPAVVKPVDNRGSFGVRIVVSEHDLRSAYLDALSNSHSRMVLVESFVEGTHITVDGYVDQGGEHINLAVATKKVLEGDRPIIYEVSYPAQFSKEVTDGIFDINSRVVDSVGITDGLTHSEYILDRFGRCYLVEIANRGGGVLTSGRILPLLTGVNVSGLLLANALGETFDTRPRQTEKNIILHFFIFEPGEVAEIFGLDEARSIEGVVQISLMVNAGDVLDSPRSGAARHGFCIVSGESKIQVEGRLQKVLETLSIAYRNQS